MTESVNHINVCLPCEITYDHYKTNIKDETIDK